MKKYLQLLFILFVFTIEGKSQTLLTIGQVYDFNINDEFHYHHPNLTPNADRIKITGKYYSALNDTVFYIRFFDNYYSEVTGAWPLPPLTYYFNSFSDTVYYTHLDTLINAQFENWPLNDSLGNWFNDTLFYATTSCGRLIYEYSGCLDCIFEGNYYHGQYGQGIGLVQTINQCPAWPQTDYQYYMSYYKKDTIACGTPDLTVSISNSEKKLNTILVYPNPVSDFITIESPQPATIEILNITGQIIKTLNPTSKHTNIDILDFAKGLYFVKIKTNKGDAVRKFVKN